MNDDEDDDDDDHDDDDNDNTLFENHYPKQWGENIIPSNSKCLIHNFIHTGHWYNVIFQQSDYITIFTLVFETCHSRVCQRQTNG